MANEVSIGVGGSFASSLGITDIESTIYDDPRERIRDYDPDWQKRSR